MTSFAADLSYVQPTSTSFPSVIYLTTPTQPCMGGVIKLDCICLHPEKRCSYMAEELDTLACRNVETKLFMMDAPCAGDAIFLVHTIRII